MTDQDIKKTDGDDDIENWLAELAGRSDGSSRDPSAEQARRIRELILARQQAAEQSVDADRLARGREQLMFRLARERLLPKASLPGRLMQQPLAMAASVAVVFVAVMVVTSNFRQAQPVIGDEVIWAYGEMDVMRGDVPQIRIVDPDPAGAATRLATRLSETGIPFQLRGDPDEQARGLRIQIAGQRLPKEVEEELARLGIPFEDAQIIDIQFIGSDQAE